MSDAPQPSNEWKSTRFWLALGVTVISIVGVTVLARTIIYQSDPKLQPNQAQGVLNSVLPLLGTWVGTILAYYFSKENFEAATKSVSALAKQLTTAEKLRSVSAKEKMIPIGSAFSKRVPQDKDLVIVDALKEMEQSKKGRRLPVLSDDLSPRYVIHRSTLDKFIADGVRKGQATNVTSATLQQLIDATPGLEGSVATVKEDATLADAKDAMDQLADCQDVFITKTGKRDAEAIGWITNVIIQDNSEV